MYGNDLSKHAFLLHPKSHRNFDPCVIKTKRTPATVSISGLGALLLFMCVCVCVCWDSHMFLSAGPPSVLGVHVQYKQDTSGSTHTHTHTHTDGCMD